jgi:Uma2 family endonuclease
MAEPARKRPARDEWNPDDEPGISVLQRWIEGPDGQMVLWETPLTPELFLDPQLEDKFLQGRQHGDTVLYLTELLQRRLQRQPDLMVVFDMKHFFGPGLRGPGPDISVIRGARNPAPDLTYFDLEEQGGPPCLIIEVVSPSDPEIRRTDEVDKVKLYERVGVEEYLLIHLPRRYTGHRYKVQGYRLGADRRYRSIEPDTQGSFLARTVGLRFGVSEDGQRPEIYDAATGERLREPIEEEAGREAAEHALRASEAARKTAEAELARMQAEIERLRRGEGG